jgi:hypothetical protein
MIYKGLKEKYLKFNILLSLYYLLGYYRIINLINLINLINQRNYLT